MMDVIWESRGWEWGWVGAPRFNQTVYTHTTHPPTGAERERDREIKTERDTERYITVQIFKALFCLQSLFRNLRVANQTPPGSKKEGTVD